MVIILDVEVLHAASDIPGIIGAPVAYNEGESSEDILKYTYIFFSVDATLRTQLLHLYRDNDPNQGQEKALSGSLLHYKVAHFLCTPPSRRYD